MNCETTHYHGCECHEEKHARKVEALHAELTEARTAARQWRETSDAQERAQWHLRQILDERQDVIARLTEERDGLMSGDYRAVDIPLKRENARLRKALEGVRDEAVISIGKSETAQWKMLAMARANIAIEALKNSPVQAIVEDKK